MSDGQRLRFQNWHAELMVRGWWTHPRDEGLQVAVMNPPVLLPQIFMVLPPESAMGAVSKPSSLFMMLPDVEQRKTDQQLAKLLSTNMYVYTLRTHEVCNYQAPIYCLTGIVWDNMHGHVHDSR